MRFSRIARNALGLGAILVSAACASTGPYTWVSELPAQEAAPVDYLIATGDVVSVRVLNQEPMTTRAKVRGDGRIAVPILGDIEVRGKRPASIRGEIEARLKDYLVAPSVTVNVEEFAPISVSVMGEVTRPGVFSMEPTANVAQLLATAGGLTDYAERDGIFVVRGGPKPLRVRFTYDAIKQGDPAALRFSLRSGDVLVVE